MMTLNEDLIEKGEGKQKYELSVSMRVKDGIRLYAIQDIISTLDANVV